MPIRITSKKNGFRRCGIEHPDTTVIYPDGRFSQEHIQQLKAEPMLIVEEIPAEKPANSTPPNPVGGMNVDLALQTINLLSISELELVIANDKRVTVIKAAQARIEELMKPPQNSSE